MDIRRRVANSACGAPDRGRHRRGLRRIRLPGVDARGRRGGRGLRGRAGGRRCRSPQGNGLGRQSRPGGAGDLRRRDRECSATLPVGAGAHDICISERAGKAYITAETINIVTTVDLETLAMDSIPVGPLPHHIEPSHDGRTIYVSLASHQPTAVGSAARTRRSTPTTIRSATRPTSDNPAARLHGRLPIADGDTLFVAHDTGNEVSGVDVETGDDLRSASRRS